MLFNSLEFLAFFAVLYPLYRLLPMAGQNWLLLGAGYVFYGWWDVRFLFLIAFSTTVDFWIGLMLGDGRVSRRSRWVASTFLPGAALLFLWVDWGAVLAGRWADMPSLTKAGAAGLAGALLAVAVANLSHDALARTAPERRRKLLLVATVTVNLGFLAIFKYLNFFVDSATDALGQVGIAADRLHLDIILPVGISFYTFQSLSYTIDVARGQMRPVHRFRDFALFVAFFPPMVAGPIERARHLLPQLTRPRPFRLRQTMHGLMLILLGLFKKVGIADGLATSVDTIYGASGTVSGSDVALATVLFAFQIFCDFSGYTDMARGIAKLLGIDLVVNFNLPYLSRNPSEFWRRWHISLSSWLRDYLYIPLGGNRRGRGRTYANLMATMTLGGLWHGAAANFLLWGVYQGALLCGWRALGGRDAEPAAPRALPPAPWRHRLRTCLAIAVMFVLICYGWLLFRAHSFDQIVQFTGLLGNVGGWATPVMLKPPLSATAGLLLLIVLQLLEWRDGRAEAFRFWSRPLQGALYAAMLTIIAMGSSSAPIQFIYFQF